MISKWGIETQPCSLPLLPKGPDSSQGAIPVAAYLGQLVAPPWDSTTSLTQSLLIVSIIASVIGCLTLASLFARGNKEYPTCRTKQHTTYSAGTSRQSPIHPNCIAVWQGPQFPRLSQGLRGFPPPTLSSDCPGWLMGPWVPQYIYVGPLAPVSHRCFGFISPACPYVPTCCDRAGAASSVSLLPPHPRTAPQAFKSARPLLMVTQVPSPLRAVGGVEARLGRDKTGGVGR